MDPFERSYRVLWSMFQTFLLYRVLSGIQPPGARTYEGSRQMAEIASSAGWNHRFHMEGFLRLVQVYIGLFPLNSYGS